MVNTARPPRPPPYPLAMRALDFVYFKPLDYLDYLSVRHGIQFVVALLLFFPVAFLVAPVFVFEHVRNLVRNRK